MFYMIAKSSILKRYPVSSSQLAQLIENFAGHSEKSVPINEMEQIASAVF